MLSVGFRGMLWPPDAPALPDGPVWASAAIAFLLCVLARETSQCTDYTRRRQLNLKERSAACHYSAPCYQVLNPKINRHVLLIHVIHRLQFEQTDTLLNPRLGSMNIEIFKAALQVVEIGF